MIFDTVIVIGPKFANSRTIDGIMVELGVHYLLYSHDMFASHANPADMGKACRKNEAGYDSNAWIFEWIATTGQPPFVFP